MAEKHDTVKQNKGNSILRIFFRILFIALIFFALMSVLFFIFRGEIRERMITELRKSTQLQITFSESKVAFWSSFPSLSLNAKDLNIRPDSLAGNSESFSLEAGNAWFSIKLPELIMGRYRIGKISIEDATIKVRDTKEKTQQALFPEALKNLEIDEASFRNVKFIFTDKQDAQLMAMHTGGLKIHGSKNDSSIHFRVDGSLEPQFNNEVLGNILNDRELGLDLEVLLMTEQDELRIAGGKLLLNKNSFGLQGQIDNEKFKFVVNAEGLNTENIKALIAMYYDEMKSGLDIAGSLDLRATVSGNMNDAMPLIQADFDIREGSYLIAEAYNFESELLSGSFTNRSSADPTKFKLLIHSAEPENEFLKISGSGSIDNLEAPQITAKVDLEYSPRENDLVFKELPFSMSGGEIRMQLEIERKRSGWGEIRAQDLVFSKLQGNTEYLQSDLVWKSSGAKIPVNGNSIRFTNNDLLIDSAVLNIQDDHLAVKAQMKNIFPALMIDELPPNMMAGVELHGKFLDLRSLLEFFGNEENESYFAFNRGRIDLHLLLDSLRYKTFTAGDARAFFIFSDDSLKIDYLKLKAFDGDISMDGTLEKQEELHKLHLNSLVTDVDVNKLFIGFDDFGMQDFTHKNLEGQANADIHIEADLDRQLNLIPASVDAVTELEINRGRLIDFKPLMHALDFLDEEGLDEIRFDRLENSIRIKNEKVHIPKMNITSSVLDLEAFGTHSFGNELDYHMRILLSDLLSKKARHRKEEVSKFGEIEDDGLGRASLYFHLKGNIEEPEFVIDKQAVRNKIKQDFLREKENTIRAFQNEFGWLRKDSAKKARDEKRKDWIKKQEEGEFLFEWGEEKEPPN